MNILKILNAKKNSASIAKDRLIFLSSKSGLFNIKKIESDFFNIIKKYMRVKKSNFKLTCCKDNDHNSLLKLIVIIKNYDQ